MIRRKEICRIIIGVQITHIIFRGNRYGSWEQIWVILSSFIRAGSIINVDGI